MKNKSFTTTSYKKIIIYFLSGTGNSYRISQQMQHIAEDKDLKTIVSSVNNAKPVGEITNNNSCILGLVFPTHGFTTPWHMIKFACRLPRVNKTHAFCVATRAGLRFGKVFTPGISGSATFLIALILFLKGFKVQGVTSLDMPSNWYSLHPIQKEHSISLIINRSHQRSIIFINKILEGKKIWLNRNNLYEMIWTTILTPISLAYLFLGRFFLAKMFFANKNCDSCGLCLKNCPVNAIEMKENEKPFWIYNCESCMRCAAFCPKNAIEAGHSWGVILWMISSIPASLYINSFLSTNFPGLPKLNGTCSKQILDIIYYFLSLSASYFIFHKLMRFPIINRLFTLTTFTHIKSWGRYREPGTKLKHLRGDKNKVPYN